MIAFTFHKVNQLIDNRIESRSVKKEYIIRYFESEPFSRSITVRPHRLRFTSLPYASSSSRRLKTRIQRIRESRKPLSANLLTRRGKVHLRPIPRRSASLTSAAIQAPSFLANLHSILRVSRRRRISFPRERDRIFGLAVCVARGLLAQRVYARVLGRIRLGDRVAERKMSRGAQADHRGTGSNAASTLS